MQQRSGKSLQCAVLEDIWGGFSWGCFLRRRMAPHYHLPRSGQSQGGFAYGGELECGLPSQWDLLLLAAGFSLRVLRFVTGVHQPHLRIATMSLLSYGWTLRGWHLADCESVFLAARLARKELRLVEVPELLKQSMDMGLDPEQAQREFLLLEAQSGRLAAVRDELNQLLMLDVPDGAEICEAYVNGAVMEGGVDLALTILPVWKESSPQDPQPFYALARILEHQQRTDEALRELDAAISLNSRHWPSLYAQSIAFRAG